MAPKKYLRESFDRLRNHRYPWVRRAAGVLLIVGGILGFMPVLGFWMLPLGLILLSDDIPWLRRQRRRLQSWIGRRYRERRDARKRSHRRRDRAPGG